jgi:hypothetical protein
MAGNRFTFSTGAVATAAATAKSVAQVKAASNVALKIFRITVSGLAAAGGTDSPSKIRLTRTTATFGTFTSGTPVKDDPGRAETLQLTAGYNCTSEPTVSASGYERQVNPQGFTIWNFDPPLIVPGGNSLQVEVTSVATPSFDTEINGEE